MHIYNLAIIGGGPGGIGSAVEATILEMDKVILIEKGANHSQTIRQFYKDRKRVDKDWKGQKTDILGKVDFKDGTKESTLDFFDELINDHKIDVRFNCEVEKVIRVGEHFEIRTACGLIEAKNVIVAIGNMGKPNKPDYPLPSTLKSKINFNLNNCSSQEKILVVGGGNSALEYAYDLSFTNNVILNYRKTEFGRANPENIVNIKEAEREMRLTLWLGSNILSVEEVEGRVGVSFDDGVSEVFDRVIYAIGGTTPIGFLQSCGIELGQKDLPILDENLQTTTKGVYVAGDLAMDSGGSIAMALNHAYTIINHIRSQM